MGATCPRNRPEMPALGSEDSHKSWGPENRIASAQKPKDVPRG